MSSRIKVECTVLGQVLHVSKNYRTFLTHISLSFEAPIRVSCEFKRQVCVKPAGAVERIQVGMEETQV